MKAVILAAGMGSRLAPLTDDRPKPLVEVGGTPLLMRTLDRLAAVGIAGADVIVVGGYRIDVLHRMVAPRRVTVVDNAHYHDWNNFWSLYVAREAVAGGSFIMIDGDVLFDDRVLPRMLAAPGPAAMSIDIRPELDPETMKVIAADGRITAVSKKLEAKLSLGEYVGLTRIDAPFAEVVFAELKQLADEGLTNEYYEHAYHRLAQRGAGPFRAVDVGDLATIEIDDLADLRRAEALLAHERRTA